MSEVKTASGKELTIPVSVRVPFGEHQRLMTAVQRDGRKISVILREALKIGLPAVIGEAANPNGGKSSVKTKTK